MSSSDNRVSHSSHRFHPQAMQDTHTTTTSNTQESALSKEARRSQGQNERKVEHFRSDLSLGTQDTTTTFSREREEKKWTFKASSLPTPEQEKKIFEMLLIPFQIKAIKNLQTTKEKTENLALYSFSLKIPHRSNTEKRIEDIFDLSQDLPSTTTLTSVNPSFNVESNITFKNKKLTLERQKLSIKAVRIPEENCSFFQRARGFWLSLFPAEWKEYKSGGARYFINIADAVDKTGVDALAFKEEILKPIQLLEDAADETVRFELPRRKTHFRRSDFGDKFPCKVYVGFRDPNKENNHDGTASLHLETVENATNLLEKLKFEARLYKKPNGSYYIRVAKANELEAKKILSMSSLPKEKILETS